MSADRNIVTFRYRTSLLVATFALVLYFLGPGGVTWEKRARDRQIDGLIEEANALFREMLSEHADSLHAATDAYTQRRHRTPPPGFEQWYWLARQHDVVMVEAFWDPIYEDLGTLSPYPAETLEALASALASTTSPLVKGFFIRNGTVSSNCEDDNAPCLQVEAMLSRIAHWLPALNLPFNGHASPRIIHSMEDAMGRTDLSWPDHSIALTIPANRTAVLHHACPLDSPLARARAGSRSHSGVESPLDEDQVMDTPPNLMVDDARSWRDVCQQPWLLRMHGALVRPNCLNISTQLMPMFASAKIAGIETAILYPDAIYWAQDPDYHAGDRLRVPWEDKLNRAFWRGSNSGGGHGPTNWEQFHRHRFVALTNASYLKSVKEGEQRDWSGTAGHVTDQMLRLSRDFLDVGFSAIGCRDDSFRSTNRPCSYLDPHFRNLPWDPLEHVVSSYRYLFDIDGNSFSGRFHSLLLSDSVVLKATIYREWHDSRLVPWLHFVPVSNHFGQDMWDVLDFFIAREDRASHIAHSAREWALRVLRPVDMELYLLRLLLEWAQMVQA
jgi:AcrR family transcriptional regulator